jgi:hypothetical protein
MTSPFTIILVWSLAIGWYAMNSYKRRRNPEDNLRRRPH